MKPIHPSSLKVCPHLSTPLPMHHPFPILTDDQLVAGAAHLRRCHQFEEAALEELILNEVRQTAADDMRQRQLRRDGQGRHHDRHGLWGSRRVSLFKGVWAVSGGKFGRDVLAAG